jgi:hypothetical protein
MLGGAEIVDGTDAVTVFANVRLSWWDTRCAFARGRRCRDRGLALVASDARSM